MEHVKQHFETEANNFDAIILKLIPYYHQMVEAIVTALPYQKNQAFRLIDLGCGTGTILKAIATQFPNSEITCVDIAENMLYHARKKLEAFTKTRFVQANFEEFEFDQTYDVVVSSLALHHLVTNEDKIRFYQKIYDCLSPQGLFWNADVVLGATEWLQSSYIEKWKAFMLQSVSMDEIENTWLVKYYAEDNPAKLNEQLSWMQAIGFSHIEIVWKYYNYAVYGGIK